jgi:hypothetical protein
LTGEKLAMLLLRLPCLRSDADGAHVNLARQGRKPGERTHVLLGVTAHHARVSLGTQLDCDHETE